MKSKLSLLVPFLILLSVSLKAQNSGVSLRVNHTPSVTLPFSSIKYIYKEPGFVDDEYSLKANSISMDLIGQIGIQDKYSVRIRFGYSNIGLKGNARFNYTGGDYDDLSGTIKQNTFVIALGLQKSALIDKLSINFGVELPLEILGKIIGKGTVIYYSAPIFDRYTYNGTVDGGIGIGLGTFLGASYNLFGPVSLGMEFSFGYKYTSLKSKVDITEYYNGVLNWSETDDEINLSGFASIPLSASLILGFKF